MVVDAAAVEMVGPECSAATILVEDLDSGKRFVPFADS
jgi:hypothetical protein